MNIKVQETADRLLNRIGVSTCSFTTVKAAKRTLEEEGACVLSMQKPHWDLEPGKTYLVTQSDSSLFAFSIGSQFLAEEAGVRVLYLPCKVTRDAIYADCGSEKTYDKESGRMGLQKR